MAKWSKKDDEPTPKEMEADAATAGPAGDEPASVGGDSAKGTPVYPPPASDTSGERTTVGVSPSKQLPTKATGNKGADEVTTLRAENARLRQVVANLGGNPDAVAKAATEGLTGSGGEPVEDTSNPRFAVSLPGQEPVEVHAKDEADARAVYMKKHGVWSLPHEPTVTKAGDKPKE